MYWLPYSSHTSHNPSQTVCLHWISYATEKQMLDSCNMLQKQSEAFHTFLWHFSKFKTEFYCISFFLTSRLHFWNPPAVKTNCCCSCSFEPETIRISQSCNEMYSNNIVNFQESTTILNACTKIWKLIEWTTDISTWLTKAWTAIDRLSVIWKSDLTDKMKRSFFPAAVVLILLCGR